MHAKSRPIFCDSMDCIPSSSSVHGIFQARILEWTAILFSKGSSQPRDQTHISCLQADSLPLSHMGNPQIYTDHTYIHDFFLFFFRNPDCIIC